MNQKVFTIFIASLLTVFLPLAGLCSQPGNPAGTEEPAGKVTTHESAKSQQELTWKEEFERLCAQTEVATALTDQQVRDLIRDSDALLEKLESLQDPQIRVYVFRLTKCRKFFEFVLQLSETG